MQAAPKGNTIVDVAIAVNSSGPFAGQFDTLIAAVLAADPAVLATLSRNGQFTVFAPTDDAFAALGLTSANIGTLDKGFLTNVLLYHVARGSRYADDVIDSSRIRMLNKGFLLQSGGVLTDNLGRTANIIVTTLSEKTHTPITARLWNKRGLPVMLVTCVVASLIYALAYPLFR